MPKLTIVIETSDVRNFPELLEEAAEAIRDDHHDGLYGTAVLGSYEIIHWPEDGETCMTCWGSAYVLK